MLKRPFIRRNLKIYQSKSKEGCDAIASGIDSETQYVILEQAQNSMDKGFRGH